MRTLPEVDHAGLPQRAADTLVSLQRQAGYATRYQQLIAGRWQRKYHTSLRMQSGPYSWSRGLGKQLACAVQ